MKYKITSKNEPDKFCSKVGNNIYLLKDENGKTLRELFEIYFNITEGIMTYKNLIELNER